MSVLVIREIVVVNYKNSRFSSYFCGIACPFAIVFLEQSTALPALDGATSLGARRQKTERRKIAGASNIDSQRRPAQAARTELQVILGLIS